MNSTTATVEFNRESRAASIGIANASQAQNRLDLQTKHN